MHGVGTFVAERPRRAQLIELRSIADEIKLAGKIHHATVLNKTKIAANRQQARRLELEPGSCIFQIQVVPFSR